MKIFNAFMKIMRKHLKTSIIYIAVFLAVGIIMTNSGSDSNSGYVNKSINISVIDNDDTAASRAAAEFMAKGNKLVTVGESKDERLDALYYQKAEIIVTIEKGYAEKLAAGETTGLFTEISVPGTYSAELFDSKLNRYISMVSAYVAGGEEPASASAKVTEDLAQEVETVMYKAEDSGSGSGAMYSFFKYLAYILVAAILSGLCPVLLIMKKKDISNRINCSKITPYSQLVQTSLGTLVFVIGVFVVIMAAAAVLFGSDMFTKTGLMAIAVALVFTIVSMMLSLFITAMSPSEKSISMISNVAGLGMSFLCGVFVPQSLLGGTALSIGKLLPAYWYVKAMDMIFEQDGRVFSAKPVIVCIGVQLAFAAALFCISLLVSKNKRQAAN